MTSTRSSTASILCVILVCVLCQIVAALPPSLCITVRGTEEQSHVPWSRGDSGKVYVHLVTRLSSPCLREELIVCFKVYSNSFLGSLNARSHIRSSNSVHTFPSSNPRVPVVSLFTHWLCNSADLPSLSSNDTLRILVGSIPAYGCRG